MLVEGEKITQKMKPCPFCGSKELRLWYNRTFGGYSVYCWMCGSQGREDLDKEVAIAAWNRRNGD
jgi:Lar family restriction alleviation protein